MDYANYWNRRTLYGGGGFGGPGQGRNGTGLGGVYYDWGSNKHKSTAQGNEEVGWNNANYAVSQYGTSVPSDTKLSSIGFGPRGVYIWQVAFTGFNDKDLQPVDAMWRFIPGKSAQLGGGTIDNTAQALSHYLFGDGSPARIGPNTTNSLLNSPQFLNAHRGIINGQSNQSGKFTVDMTKRVFHIGRTNVSYSIAPGGHSVTYNLYDGDGFWDPDFIDEKYLGPNSPYFKPDGPGPNLERFGGTPYYYIPTIITFPF